MHGKLLAAAGLPEISETVDGGSPAKVVAGADPGSPKHAGRARVDELDVPEFLGQQRLKVEADNKEGGNNDKPDAQTRP